MLRCFSFRSGGLAVRARDWQRLKLTIGWAPKLFPNNAEKWLRNYPHRCAPGCYRISSCAPSRKIEVAPVLARHKNEVIVDRIEGTRPSISLRVSCRLMPHDFYGKRFLHAKDRVAVNKRVPRHK